MKISSISCSTVAPFVVSYCFGVLERNYMSGVQHGTTVYRTSILSLVSHEQFCSMNDRHIFNRARILSAQEGYSLIMDKASAMKVAIHRQIKRDRNLEAERIESKLSLSSDLSLLERVKDAVKLFPEDTYSLLPF